jgi:hypothetical protein
MGKYPMQIHWLTRVVKLWNKLIINKAESELLTETLASNVHFGISHNRPCWTYELLHGLEFVMPDHNWREHMLGLEQIDAKAITNAARLKFCNNLDNYRNPAPQTLNPLEEALHELAQELLHESLYDSPNPTHDDCPYRNHCCYQQWMHQHSNTTGPDAKLCTPAYLSAQAPRSAKAAVARFRLNNARIQANTTHHHTKYSDRICTRCAAASNNTIRIVDNEHHVLFECICTRHIRNKHLELFDSSSTVAEFMRFAYSTEHSKHFIDCITKIMRHLKCGPNDCNCQPARATRAGVTPA